MSLLLVVVLLFFSSSSSVSSHQYYVSDDCNSVLHTPCNPLSVYAGDMSQYNNSIFYFIGAINVTSDVNLISVENVTLHGTKHSKINCIDHHFLIKYSSHVTFCGLLLYTCNIQCYFSNNVTIEHSETVDSTYFEADDAFDIKVSSTIFRANSVTFNFHKQCNSELLTYTLSFTNVTIVGQLELYLFQGASYNMSVMLDNTSVNGHLNPTGSCVYVHLKNSLLSLAVKKSSFRSGWYGFSLFSLALEESKCLSPIVPLLCTISIEDSHFYGNNDAFFIKANLINKHPFFILIKSCSIRDSARYGLRINVNLLSSVTIDITDAELIGNAANLLVSCHSITLSNVTIANSLSTGLTLRQSIVTVNNSLIFRNNTGISGGGLSITHSSYFIVLPQASFEFINNSAAYKGGGFFCSGPFSHPFVYAEPYKDPLPLIPLTFWNNTAVTAGNDIYGFSMFSFSLANVSVSFSLINPSVISSATDAVRICFCDFSTSMQDYICLHNVHEQHIFPGQRVKFKVALFGYNSIGTPFSLTDGEVDLLIDGTRVFTYSLHEANCSFFEYSPGQFIYTRHKVVLLLPHNELVNNHPTHSRSVSHYTMHECPIGFSIDSYLWACTCSQSVSRENVTCDINSQNITHNGLLWIGTYDTNTPFNANATNPNACIINEDCLLYCSPNPVTFQLNDTDTQCVDNRGQRMCGSCRDGYSLLMGSNKCGHCNDNYMIIAWIALFAVMGVLLVVLLIALNLTVSVGTLNGLLFYANIVKLYEPVFSRKGALPVLSQVISWINLDFGFEICFYNGMDSYAKQWLQFAFPLYLWFVIIVIIKLCRRYGKISRLMGSHAVPVLSTLFLLSYTKLVRTIVIVLHKREVTLHCTNESVRSVSLWYEDPNVEYAKGKHAGLFGFALFVSVIFVIPYTLFLLLSPLIEKYLSNYKVFRKCWSCFKPIVDAYSGPMKDQYRFWPGLLLVARIPILLSVTLVDSLIHSHYFLLFMLLTVLAIVLSLGYSFRGVYRERMLNIIEVWFLFNLCIMVGFSVAYTDDSMVGIWFNTCLSLFTLSFILIVLYHLYLQLLQTLWYKAFATKLFNKPYNGNYDEPLLDVTDSHKTVDEQKNDIIPSSTDIFRHRRESVVDLF